MTTFVILSFEGSDPYAHAGGLGSRVTSLTQALADAGFQTHLFFIGDPDRPGEEPLNDGNLVLHRWCQWISRHHPYGVYDGEEGKLRDWNTSLPGWLETHLLAPKVLAGESVVVIGEEWQTAHAIIALSKIIVRRGWQGRVHLFWNANNTYSFDRIDWQRLRAAASFTTVSRYMKHVMAQYGVEARVIPNGISESWFEPLSPKETLPLTRLLADRLSLVKIARWHPDKRWLSTVDAVAELKQQGLRPLFLARGGLEDYGGQVVERAKKLGLEVGEARWYGKDVPSLVEGLFSQAQSDMVVLQSRLSETQSKALYHTTSAVLANSSIEPFGLVGLEAMAAGAVVFVGCTGEDYVTTGYDAIALQSDRPRELVRHLANLRGNRDILRRLKAAGRRTASRYTWPAVISRVLLPYLDELGIAYPTVLEPYNGRTARGVGHLLAAAV